MARIKGLLYRCIWLGISMTVLATHARHLVGGDMTYRCLGVDAQGQSRYEITLKVYRDCREQSPGQPNTPFDREVSIAVFNNATLQQILEFKTRLTDSTILSLRGSDPCVPPPPGLCYAEGVYRDTITLAPAVRGYTLEWGRCCRNETIRNIFQPGSAGVVFTASIPNTTLCNNSPAFKNALPTYICVNDLFTFDHSATDADGDSLVYRITTPFTAGSPLDPFPLPMPPPYPQVTWLGGYGTTNYMDGNPDITLDPISGNMEVRPTQLGQYVFSVSVYEYRNGTLLSEIKRDLQINVIECPINYPPKVSLASGPDVRGDTLVFYQGELGCFDLSILDINGPGVKVDSIRFSVTGEVLSPPYNASLTLTTDQLSPEIARICWNPGCTPLPIRYSQLYISMTDNNDCPGPNQSFDTLILQVLPPPIPAPELTCIRTTGTQVVELNWDVSVSPPGGFDAWIIYRDTGTGWSPLTTLPDPDLRQYTDSSAGAAACYYITMRTVCPVPVIGPPSDTICLSSKPEVSLCQVTQDPTASVATLSWTFNDVTDFSGYRVYRRLPGSQTFALIAELTDPALRSYTDPLPPDAGPVCYQLSVQDNCGIEQFTGEHCLMDLEAQEQGFRGILSWSAYTGWTPVGYEVWRTGPDSSEVLIATTGASPTVWIDLRLPETQPTICYRIKAIPPDGICGTESWSPQRCIALEPIVFLPTAFTPNGDNINDVFRASAVFAQTFEMVIYNRWGREVFRTLDPVSGWDGTARGQAQPEGVYLCRIRWTDRLGARFEQAGSVTLIR